MRHASAGASRSRSRSRRAVLARMPRQRWIMAEPHPEAAAALAREARLPQVLAELLIARGITVPPRPTPSSIPSSPTSTIRFSCSACRLPSSARTRHRRHEPILLYGDYDVDGTTAVVLLKTAIEMLGGKARFHVPHRLREGYGLQSSVLEAAYAEGVRLVITVDTGMRAFAEAETAHRLGLDLIITDHHSAPGGRRRSPRPRHSQSQPARLLLS